MAAVRVTMVGTFTTADGSAVGGTFEGSMHYTGLGVGGGPIMPPAGPVDPGWGIPEGGRPAHPIAPPGQPPGIWIGGPPVAAPPIYLPPVNPGEPPLTIWGPGDPRPQPPIHLPGPPPDVTPSPPDVAVKPPPADGGWGYIGAPGFGWGYFPQGGAGPKR